MLKDRFLQIRIEKEPIVWMLVKMNLRIEWIECLIIDWFALIHMLMSPMIFTRRSGELATSMTHLQLSVESPVISPCSRRACRPWYHGSARTDGSEQAGRWRTSAHLDNYEQRCICNISAVRQRARPDNTPNIFLYLAKYFHNYCHSHYQRWWW